MKHKPFSKGLKILFNLPKSLSLGVKLLKDVRVSKKNKLIFLSIALGYLIFPLDLIVDIPLIGQIDDFAVFLFLFNWFIKTIPSTILDEYGWFDDLEVVKEENEV